LISLFALASRLPCRGRSEQLAIQKRSSVLLQWAERKLVLDCRREVRNLLDELLHSPPNSTCALLSGMDLPGIYFHLKHYCDRRPIQFTRAVLTKRTTMRTSSRRTGEQLLPNAIRKGPCCGRLSREESGREFFGRHRSWAFWGWWMWFLVHFPDRHA